MRARLEALLLIGIFVTLPQRAKADEPSGPTSHLHATLGVGRAAGEPQSHELGWGGQASVGYELRFARIVGLELDVNAFVLAAGDPPSDPHFATRGSGTGLDGVLAVRLTPFGRSAKLAERGPWLEGGAGVIATGALARPVVEARVGWDLVSLGSSDAKLGPFVGYTQVIQPDDTLRPEDAHILWLGASLDLPFGGTRAKARSDRDGDGIDDPVDACPEVPGVETTNPSTNGCPPPRIDRDVDGVYDEEDACPEVHGIRTNDPRTNGCPPPAPDRDRDSIHDADDACPDVPGVRTNDARTNGCPLPPDRDKDGVLDGVDACPDVPGVATQDPATNGCPKATEMVRVEGDQILLGDLIFFDTGSPRVRHVSWPLLKKLADYFNANPDIEQVLIEGHADEVGTSDYNLYLSRERAASVKRLLVKYGVAETKLTTTAYGEARPREAGHDEKAHKENRRVEFTITHAREGTTPAAPQPPGAAPKGAR